MGAEEKLIPFTDRDEMRVALSSADRDQNFVVIRRDTLENVYKLTKDLDPDLMTKAEVAETLSDIKRAINDSIELGSSYIDEEKTRELTGAYIEFGNWFADQEAGISDLLGKIAILAAKSRLLDEFIPVDIKPEDLVGQKEAIIEMKEQRAHNSEVIEKQKDESRELREAMQTQHEQIKKYGEMTSRVGGIERVYKD